MKRFLTRLLTLFTGLRRSNNAAFVTDFSDVARFVFDKRDLWPDGRPKRGAFKVDFHPDLKRYEMSVCGLNGVTEERLWFLGRTIRAAESRFAIAVVGMPVKSVVLAGLRCKAAPEYHFPEHGVVLGWNSNPEAKSERLQQQADLAALIPASAIRRAPS